MPASEVANATTVEKTIVPTTATQPTCPKMVEVLNAAAEARQNRTPARSGVRRRRRS
jgi:hypothetical protein